MKKALKLLVMYFVFLIVIAVLGTLFYSLYANILSSVIGKSGNSVVLKDFVKTLFYILFVVFVIICPLVIYIRIRHVGGFLQFLVFIIISVVNWAIFIPLTLSFGQKYSFYKEYSFEGNSLSKDFFRQSENKVYYFADDLKNDSEGNGTVTVIIDTDQNGEVAVKKINDTPDFDLYESAKPYRDILMKQNFVHSKISLSMLIDFKFLLARAIMAYNSGFSFYLGFMSLGLLLCALYAISNLFEWRLVNATFVSICTLGILSFNTIYFYPSFNGLRNAKINNNVFVSFLSQYLEQPLLVIINIVFSLILIAIGVIHYVLRKNKNKQK